MTGNVQFPVFAGPLLQTPISPEAFGCVGSVCAKAVALWNGPLVVRTDDAAALRAARLTAHVSTKLNRSHLVAGATALILPCLGRTEADRGQFVSTENATQPR